MDAAVNELFRFLLEEGILDQQQVNVIAARLERNGHSARAHEIRSIPLVMDDAPPTLKSVT